jgi:SAM-dependent methyltransferase
MQRVPEPELMDGEAQARAYAEADFDEPNSRFLDLFATHFPGPLRGSVLDLGCGPADIPVRFARVHPECRVDAVDGSAAMLRHAARAVEGAGLAERVRLVHGVLPDPALPRGHYAAVISNSLLHHLARPEVLWQAVGDCAAPGAAVLVMDLSRPASEAAASALVDTHAADAPQVLRRDFFNSLCAAFRVEEVRAQLDAAGLHGLIVAPVSDRHLAVHGRLP